MNNDDGFDLSFLNVHCIEISMMRAHDFDWTGLKTAK